MQTFVSNFSMLVFALDVFNEAIARQQINERAVLIYTACDCLLCQKSFNWLQIFMLDL
jgi:hypothetical protein